MKKVLYSAPSVKKAFKILQIIADSSTGLGVSDLSKQSKIGKSTVHGITAALEEMGVLVRDPVHKKYHVGYTLLELGRKAYTKMDLKDVARKPMERLMGEVGETVFLGVLNGDHVTILDVVESSKEMKITSPPGTRLPLLVGATGRVLLAQLEKEKAKEIIQRTGLARYTSRSVVDPKQFLKEVDRAREMGYAIDDEEYILGVKAIAAPIQTTSLPPAAIWVVGFTSTLDHKKEKVVCFEIQKTAMEINHFLKTVINGVLNVQS
jgi:IclR family transcriptional regulator, KDG regulon repressor